MSNIQDYLAGLVPQRTKEASPDLSYLSLSDLEELMGIKSAEEIMYTGGVGNGDPKHPGWPRAALGVDGANRPATPEEKREQSKVVTPDVAHTTPKRTGEPFVKKAVSDQWIARGLTGGVATRFAKAGVQPHPDVVRGIYSGARQGLPATEGAVRRAVGRAGGSPQQIEQEVRAGRSAFVRASSAGAPRRMSPSDAAARHAHAQGMIQAYGGPTAFGKAVADSASKLANLATTAARGLAHAPPIPAAARAVRPAGGMFAPAPGPSPFMGLGAAPKLAPARPLPANSMQTPQFLARQPGGAGMLEAVGAVNEISRMPGKAQSLALGKRMGIGSDVAAHRAHLANTQGMTHLASLDLSRFFAKLAGTLDPAVTARARAYMSQIAQRHAIVRDAIPDMAATGARLRAAAAAKEQVHAPVVAAVKSFPRPAGVTPPSIPSAPVSPYGTTVPNTRLGTTAPSSTAPIPGSGRRRPAWAAPPSMGEAPAASVAKTMVARPR